MEMLKTHSSQFLCELGEKSPKQSSKSKASKAHMMDRMKSHHTIIILHLKLELYQI
jgi:hypothetical protein